MREKPLICKGKGNEWELLGMSSGAGCRVRTRDPLITNQVLYQLS